MTDKMVTAKVFRVGCPPSVEKIDASIAGLQKLVAGYIEGITLEPGYILYCNEEGRRLNLPPNLQLPNGVVVLGDAVLVRHDSDGEAISLSESEPEVFYSITGKGREVIEHLKEENAMSHTPMPWAVIYYSHDSLFEVQVVEDKMVADGLAEEADKTTEGNVQTLSLPAHKLLEACNAHDPLLEAARLGLSHMQKLAGDAASKNALLTAAAIDVDIEKAEKAIALAEGEKGE